MSNITDVFKVEGLKSLELKELNKYLLNNMATLGKMSILFKVVDEAILISFYNSVVYYYEDKKLFYETMYSFLVDVYGVEIKNYLFFECLKAFKYKDKEKALKEVFMKLSSKMSDINKVYFITYYIFTLNEYRSKRYIHLFNDCSKQGVIELFSDTSRFRFPLF